MAATDISHFQTQFMQMVKGDLSLDNLTQAKRIGLAVYRNNMLATAKRSLSLSYPVIAKMIGDDAMAFLATKLLSLSPPQKGDWAEWGEMLSELIERTPLHTTHPYLADMAKLEWLTHTVGKMAEVSLDVDSLTLLEHEDLTQIYLLLSPSLKTLQSDFPISQLRTVHRPFDPKYLPSHGELALVVEQASNCELLIVAQRDGLPNVVGLSEAEFTWLAKVQEGWSLEQLLSEFPDFDFAGWLQKAIQEGWVIGIARRNNNI